MVVDCQKMQKVCNGNSFSSMGRGPPRVVLLGMYSPTPRPASCCLLAWHRHTTHSSERPGLANSKTSKDYIIPHKISKWHPILGPPCPGWSLNERFYGKCLSETSSALPIITCGNLAILFDFARQLLNHSSTTLGAQCAGFDFDSHSWQKS